MLSGEPWSFHFYCGWNGMDLEGAGRSRSILAHQPASGDDSLVEEDYLVVNTATTLTVPVLMCLALLVNEENANGIYPGCSC